MSLVFQAFSCLILRYREGTRIEMWNQLLLFPYQYIPLLNVSRRVCCNYCGLRFTHLSFLIFNHNPQVILAKRWGQHERTVDNSALEVCTILVDAEGFFNCRLNNSFTSFQLGMFSDNVVVPSFLCTNDGYTVSIDTPDYGITPTLYT